MPQAVVVASVVFLLMSTSRASWLAHWVNLFPRLPRPSLTFQNFRHLLQRKEERGGNRGTKLRPFNLSCTWSDEIFCYLDYFEHVPDSDIKSFYIADEVASLLLTWCLMGGIGMQVYMESDGVQCRSRMSVGIISWERLQWLFCKNSSKLFGTLFRKPHTKE